MSDSPISPDISPEDVTSPCISVCAVDKTLGMCIGCLRTLKEIGAWRSMTLAEKKVTVDACAARALTMPRRGKDWRPLPTP